MIHPLIVVNRGYILTKLPPQELVLILCVHNPYALNLFTLLTLKQTCAWQQLPKWLKLPQQSSEIDDTYPQFADQETGRLRNLSMDK